MNRYEEYIARCCRTGKYTPEEARTLALSRAVKAYYKDEDKDQAPVHHEFMCSSEG